MIAGSRACEQATSPGRRWRPGVPTVMWWSDQSETARRQGAPVDGGMTPRMRMRSRRSARHRRRASQGHRETALGAAYAADRGGVWSARGRHRELGRGRACGRRACRPMIATGCIAMAEGGQRTRLVDRTQRTSLSLSRALRQAHGTSTSQERRQDRERRTEGAVTALFTQSGAVMCSVERRPT